QLCAEHRRQRWMKAQKRHGDVSNEQRLNQSSSFELVSEARPESRGQQRKSGFEKLIFDPFVCRRGVDLSYWREVVRVAQREDFSEHVNSRVAKPRDCDQIVLECPALEHSKTRQSLARCVVQLIERQLNGREQARGRVFRYLIVRGRERQ